MTQDARIVGLIGAYAVAALLILFVVVSPVRGEHVGGQGHTHEEAHGGGHSEAQPVERNDKPQNTVTAAVLTAPLLSRTLEGQTLDLYLDPHVEPGKRTAVSLGIADARTGTPAAGLKVQIMPVYLGAGAGSGGHDEGAEAEHHPDSSVSVITADEVREGRGRYEAQYTFQELGPYLLLVRTSAADGEVAALPVTVGGDDEHAEGSGLPNYWFVGTLLSLVGITIAVVAVLRKREVREVRRRVGHA